MYPVSVIYFVPQLMSIGSMLTVKSKVAAESLSCEYIQIQL